MSHAAMSQDRTRQNRTASMHPISRPVQIQFLDIPGKFYCMLFLLYMHVYIFFPLYKLLNTDFVQILESQQGVPLDSPLSKHGGTPA